MWIKIGILNFLTFSGAAKKVFVSLLCSKFQGKEFLINYSLWSLNGKQIENLEQWIGKYDFRKVNRWSKQSTKMIIRSLAVKSPNEVLIDDVESQLSYDI